jgi:hypothetical protein
MISPPFQGFLLYQECTAAAAVFIDLLCLTPPD